MTEVDTRDEFVRELHAMIRHATAQGLPVPSDVLAATLAAPDDAWVDRLPQLADAHARLARLVAPATPGSLALLAAERADGRWRFLGPVRLVRMLLAAAVAFLVLFVLTSLSPHVSTDGEDIFEGAGLSLLVQEVFLLSAAGMGATFAALSRANRYIANGTFDPTYEASYWMHVVLGLIAGTVLAALIPIGDGTLRNRPLLALLGGFSASLVHRVLDRLVGTLESAVAGNAPASAPPHPTEEHTHA